MLCAGAQAQSPMWSHAPWLSVTHLVPIRIVPTDSMLSPWPGGQPTEKGCPGPPGLSPPGLWPTSRWLPPALVCLHVPRCRSGSGGEAGAEPSARLLKQPLNLSTRISTALRLLDRSERPIPAGLPPRPPLEAPSNSRGRGAHADPPNWLRLPGRFPGGPAFPRPEKRLQLVRSFYRL